MQFEGTGKRFSQNSNRVMKYEQNDIHNKKKRNIAAVNASPHDSVLFNDR